MKAPKLLYLPKEVRQSLERMRCGIQDWEQDSDGDILVTVPVIGTNKVQQFVYIWCDPTFVLWSFAISEVEDEDEPDDDDVDEPALAEPDAELYDSDTEPLGDGGLFPL